MARITSKNSINFFISQLQAKRPSPGGGAVAALVGALGVALIIKVANYTLGKGRYRRYESQIKAILTKANNVKNRLSGLIEKDARAYEGYAKTKSRTALKKATLCVEEISKLSKAALIFYKRLRQVGNVNLKGDLDAAGELLDTSIEIADNLVKLNRRKARR